jgi:hypothetical protein
MDSTVIDSSTLEMSTVDSISFKFAKVQKPHLKLSQWSTAENQHQAIQRNTVYLLQYLSSFS